MQSPIDPNHRDKFLERKWSEPTTMPPIEREYHGGGLLPGYIFSLVCWVALYFAARYFL